jgi:hypothetical protein
MNSTSDNLPAMRALVASWREAIANSDAIAALNLFNNKLSSGLDEPVARAFIASLFAFNRGTPAGIAQLAGRWADDIATRDPLHAHRYAARMLEAAVDEFGLAHTDPHVELFAAFAGRWGITPAGVFDRTLAVPASRTLGDKVFDWYRTAPLTTAMAIHFVSEETSTAEFTAWGRIFPDEPYAKVHAVLEPGHSTDAGDCLALHLAAHPDGVDEAQAAIAPYLDLYRAMFEELDAIHVETL